MLSAYYIFDNDEEETTIIIITEYEYKVRKSKVDCFIGSDKSKTYL